MHWVDRGAEPDRLPTVRARYGRKWVEYYINNSARKPNDSHWRQFHIELSTLFQSICGYCEEECRGEVDHFRPKTQFPGLVYEWDNWIFSCHECNHAKLDRWPGRGYVDPCARSRPARPDRYFAFDIVTGMILPAGNLSSLRHQKGNHPARAAVNSLLAVWVMRPVCQQPGPSSSSRAGAHGDAGTDARRCGREHRRARPEDRRRSSSP